MVDYHDREHCLLTKRVGVFGFGSLSLTTKNEKIQNTIQITNTETLQTTNPFEDLT